MAGVNKGIIVGYVGKDPETKTFASGDTAVSFSVAVTEKVRGEDQTTWFEVQPKGQAADFATQYLKKGALVCVEGKMKARAYINKETGEAKAVQSIVTWNLTSLGGQKHERPQQQQQQFQPQGQFQPPQTENMWG